MPVELYLLGRKLMKIAEDALLKPATRAPPTSVRMILIDIAEHPDSSVGGIASRTGFPQSRVVPTEVEEVIEALDGLAARLMPANDRHRIQPAGTRREVPCSPRSFWGPARAG